MPEDVTIPSALTDNSGGTADSTVAAVPAATAATTDTSAASLASVNTALTALKNDVADLAAKVNALRTADTQAPLASIGDVTANDPATR